MSGEDALLSALCRAGACRVVFEHDSSLHLELELRYVHSDNFLDRPNPDTEAG